MVKTDYLIGGLTLKERQAKVLRFLHKKKNRQGRKFHYHSRQIVASGRLRVKGRFIKNQEALEMLGLMDNINLTKEVLQGLLNERFPREATPQQAKDTKAEWENSAARKGVALENSDSGLSFFGIQHVKSTSN